MHHHRRSDRRSGGAPPEQVPQPAAQPPHVKPMLAAPEAASQAPHGEMNSLCALLSQALPDAPVNRLDDGLELKSLNLRVQWTSSNRWHLQRLIKGIGADGSVFCRQMIEGDYAQFDLPGILFDIVTLRGYADLTIALDGLSCDDPLVQGEG